MSCFQHFSGMERKQFEEAGRGEEGFFIIFKRSNKKTTGKCVNQETYLLFNIIKNTKVHRVCMRKCVVFP